MGDKQKEAGKEIVAYVKKKYGFSKVQRHKDVGSTDCPGKNFPFSEIAEASGSVTVTEEKEGSGDLKVDGWWGVKTTRLLQKIFGTPVDGIVSNQDPAQKKYLLRADSSSWDFKGQGNGSDLIGAMQKKVGVKDDGFMGPKTIKAWQKYLGVSVDGKMGEKTVKAIQKWANEQA